ncbi:MAG: hypothetical protein KJT03_01425 [Verrucomicrobiae bacterium]|nr:hypothetical protein [Verrucomicrobiae bacterium]
MIPNPEDALKSHLPDPPQTKRPLSFLEWSSAGIGLVALVAEVMRRLFPNLETGTGVLVFQTVIFISVGLACIQGIPVLVQELLSRRRGTADYYMLCLLAFCIFASAFQAQRNWQDHFLGVLPILFAGYGISKRKYREYQESLQLVSDTLAAGGGPQIEVLEESRQSHRVGLASVKAGDLMKVSAGDRIWISGIIDQGYGLLNQASSQATPVPRRCRRGDTIIPGEVLIEGELIVRATENGQPPPSPKHEHPQSWLTQFQSLVFNRRQRLLTIVWINLTVFIICTQFTVSLLEGDWRNALTPSLSILIGLNPWGIVLILPLLWRRRFTVTAFKGIRFRSLRLVELFGSQLEVVVEKTGVLTEPGISRKKIILSKHFRGKSPFLIRAIRAMEDEAGISLGAHYFAPDPKEIKVQVRQLLQSDKGTIEAEIYDEEEHRIFIRVGSLRSMPYFTHNGFKQLNAQAGEQPPRQRLFVTLNDVPAAIFVWDETVKEPGLTFLNEAKTHGLPVKVITKDIRTKLENIGDQPVQRLDSAKAKMNVVQEIQKQKKPVLYIGYGRNDVPAMAAASSGIMIENGDPYALPFADAVLTNAGLRLVVDEWLRFKKARKIAQSITITAITQGILILALNHTHAINPWLATLLTGITGSVMMLQTLKVEK